MEMMGNQEEVAAQEASARAFMARRDLLRRMARLQMQDVAALPLGDRLQISHYRLMGSVSPLAIARAQAAKPCAR